MPGKSGPTGRALARLDDRRDRGVHACGPGARDGQSQAVRGLKRVPQQLLRAVHQDQEVRVEMAEERRGHRGRHARVNHVGSRAEQDPWGHVVRRECRRLHAQVRHDRLTPSSRCAELPPDPALLSGIT